MLRQYYSAKQAHPGVLMAIRVGDFYEFYGDDAETAARALEITLTGREDGSNGRIAMAGVPHHSVEKYLARLVAQGFKVALCDQLEDPKTVKGLVKRGVTRVLSAGTVMEDSMLAEGAVHHLCGLIRLDSNAAIATLDPSTGEFAVCEVIGPNLNDAVLAELARLRPAELIFTDNEAEIAEIAHHGLKVTTTSVRRLDLPRSTDDLKRQFGTANLGGFGLEDRPAMILACALVIEYARKSGLELTHVTGVTSYSLEQFMRLDPATRRSLELTQNVSDGSTRHTLFEAIHRTMTAMGTRLLKKWIDQPELDPARIERRHEAVERLIEHAMTRGDLRECLKRFSDIERLVSRCATGLASPRDLAGLRNSLRALPDLDSAFHKVARGRLGELRELVGRHEDLTWNLDRALAEEVPHTLKDGGVIRDGFDAELDSLRSLSKDGRSFIAKLEANARAETGIDKLKVGFNNVFGYYLEVPRSVSDQVPAHYIRKQTTANTERFITSELKEQENRVLGAQDQASLLEQELFVSLRNQVAGQATELLQTARAIAELDVLCCFAEVAVDRRFTRPVLIQDRNTLSITGGRHPVVEAHASLFVPNDLKLDDHRLLILTGPNMSGKSTYLRQAALITILAQIGSFVPAERCELSICDRVFARIGARDEIALGQSTFMVEMVESANILNHATESSLVILDEIGRGTSTFDGLSIAWAMVEFLAQVGCKCLFATHYHQLNTLAETMPKVANFRVDVEEHGDEIVWTHRVVPGGADRSYGIQVARMAGVPSSVLSRAKTILRDLESGPDQPLPVTQKSLQLTLFDEAPSGILKELSGLDVSRLTPIEALLKLDEWKKTL